MAKCCAPMCTNSTYNKSPNITFHRFPKDCRFKTAWLANVNRKCWQPKRSSVLCSAHFEPHLVHHNGFRSLLTAAAVPTIFDLKENKSTSKAHEQLNGSKYQDNLQDEQNLELVSAVVPSNKNKPTLYQNMEAVKRLTENNVLKSKKIRLLNQQIRRLKKKLVKFANIISSLNEKLKDKYN